jgi:hypothetical protein
MNTRLSTHVNSTSPEEMERVIEQQREELAKTVDALQAKFDVRSHARHRAGQVRRHPERAVVAAVAVAAVVALVVWRRRR